MKSILAERLVVLLTCGFFIALSILTSGCAGSRVQVEYEKDDSSEYSEPHDKPKHKKGGPPAHAPAHGYRAKYHYYYYPSSAIMLAALRANFITSLLLIDEFLIIVVLTIKKLSNEVFVDSIFSE